jgi:hypothetical protein
MWIAEVIDALEDMPLEALNEAEKEMLQKGYEVFYSSGAFRDRKSEGGHSLIVLYDELQTPPLWHVYWPSAFSSFPDARPAFCLFGQNSTGPKGNRTAYVDFLSERPETVKYWKPPHYKETEERVNFTRIKDHQEYLRHTGDLFTNGYFGKGPFVFGPGVTSCHCELSVMQPDVTIHGVMPFDVKTYREVALL